MSTLPSADTPLGTVRGRRYSANYLGRVERGGAWVFLLPTLELRRAVLAGRTDPAAVDQLRGLAAEVTSAEAAGEAQPDDLLVVGRASVDPLAPPRIATLAASVLAAGGIVYFEQLCRRGTRPRSADRPTEETRYVAWPAHGPITAANPRGKARMASWLAAQGLTESSGRMQLRLQAIARRGRDVAWQSGLQPTSAAARDPLRRGMKKAARATFDAATAVAGGADRGWQWISGQHRDLVLLGARAGTPNYLHEMAAGVGGLAGHDTALVAAGSFRSQKNLLVSFPEAAPQPQYITKVGRDSTANPRLETAAAVLTLIHERALLPVETVPRVAFVGKHAGLRFVAETAVSGERFETLTTGDASCPWAARAVSLLTGLATASRTPVPAERVVEAIHDLLERATAAGAISAGHVPRLRSLADELNVLDPWPCVVQHGDPGTWNIVARTDGGVTLLDWENGEPLGMPLWDVAYFVRSFGALLARRRGLSDRLEASMFLFRDPELRTKLHSWVGTYTTALGLPTSVVGPLFYHALVYQALKESSRLPEGQASRGIFARTLAALLDDESPFAKPADGSQWV